MMFELLLALCAWGATPDTDPTHIYGYGTAIVSDFPHPGRPGCNGTLIDQGTQLSCQFPRGIWQDKWFEPTRVWLPVQPQPGHGYSIMWDEYMTLQGQGVWAISYVGELWYDGTVWRIRYTAMGTLQLATI